MERRKVIFVEREDKSREMHAAVMGIMGYEVYPYKDGQSALANIVENGHAPFVLVGTFDMGDIYTADEMKRCLDTHSRRTGVNYGVVSFNVPRGDAARNALAKVQVPYTDDFDLTDISKRVDSEFERIAPYDKLNPLGKMLLCAAPVVA